MTKRQHIEAQRLKPIGVAGIEACRRIATEGPTKINEVFVDAFTASAIVAVYDALNEANRANLARGFGIRWDRSPVTKEQYVWM